MEDLSSYEKEEINGINVIIKIIDNYDIPVLKTLADALSNNLNGLVCLISVVDSNINIVVKSSNEKIDASHILKELLPLCNGKGGGNKTLAQGGGQKIDDLTILTKKVKEIL